MAVITYEENGKIIRDRERLTTKTWTTTDADGCEFRVTAWYGLVSTEDVYEGLGITAKSLKELKEQVSRIGR